MTNIFSATAQAAVSTPLVFLVAAAVAVAANEALFRLLKRLGRRSADRSSVLAIARRCWWPSRFMAVAIAFELVLPLAHLSPPLAELVQHLLVLAIIGITGWLAAALSFVVEDIAFARFRIDVDNNLRARRVRTRVNVVRRITVVAVTLLAVAAMLTTFDQLRSLGTTLLASAGIAGLVIGIAARPLVSNVLAGLQIFFAEPLRIDDVIVIENEWGRVEEISLTYIVVRTWDERALVLPLTYFLDKPFENWTRETTHLLAAVHVAVDFTVPVERVRQELRRVLDTSALWDGRTWNLQVTEIGKESVELRALMSARDAATAWDLRCEVREKLLQFLRSTAPNGFPRRWVSLAESKVDALAPNH